VPVITKQQDAILKQWEQAGLIWKIDMSKLRENESIWKRFCYGFSFGIEPSANPIAKLLNRGSENE
jgi:hypothetical protein